MDTDRFFHPTGEQPNAPLKRIALAKLVCANCAVTDACLQYALDTVEGGHSELERARMLGLRSMRHPARANQT